MPDEATLIKALDLAERLLDELAAGEQDWFAVARVAGAIAELAAQAAGPPGPERPGS